MNGKNKMDFEYKIDGYKLICRVIYLENANILSSGKLDEQQRKTVAITGVRGSGGSLVIPEQVEYQGNTYEMVRIDKKAFLGLKILREVTLPDSICQIDDWAFAQCAKLQTIRFHIGTELGIGVFEDCMALSRIEAYYKTTDKETECEEDLAVLLAACVNGLQGEDLLRDVELGSAHWYQKWDQRLLSFLQEDDEEGYQTMVLCGEEDIPVNVPEYVVNKQMRKCDLCMTRLLHNQNTSDVVNNMDAVEYSVADTKSAIQTYLLSRIKGQGNEAFWKAIIKWHGEDRRYYNLLAELGGITKDNVDAMIEELDTKYAEAKAYLIQYKQEHFGTEDVFAGFEL